MAKYPFILSSDHNFNSYGFRVLTSGIDTIQYVKNPIVLYMHNRAWEPKNVVGKGSNVRIEGTQLLMDVEFDSEDDYAKELEGKVKRGFIKMCSIGGDVVETSDAPEFLLAGQTKPTVTKMRLKEVSIVDIGSNDEAMRLYDNAGQLLQLADFPIIETKTKTNTMKELELFAAELAVKLGLPSNATTDQVMSAAVKSHTESVDFKGKLAAIELADKAAKGVEAIALVNKAVELKVLPVYLKDLQLAAFDTDFAGAKTSVQAMIDAAPKAEAEGAEGATEVKLSQAATDFLAGLKSTGKDAGVKGKTMNDFTEKELQLMQENSPEKFEVLVGAYEGTQF